MGDCSGWDGKSLVKKGDGTLELHAASDYTGGSTIEAGTLAAKTENALGAGAVTIASAGTLVVDHDGIFANDLAGNGLVESRGGVSLTGDMSGHLGETHAYGRLMLGAPSTSVASGAAFTVREGGLLGGVGEIGHLRVERGATLSPGHSIGTIAVSGNVVFESGSFFDVEVDPDGSNSGRLAVAGTADLGGATVRHIAPGAGPDYSPIGEWTILTAAGGLNGTTFADQVAGDFAFLDQRLEYRDDTDVLLVISRNARAFGDFAMTRNQGAVADALDSLSSGGLYNDMVALPAGTDLGRAYDTLSGEMHASVRGMLQNYDRGFAGTMLRRVVSPVDPGCGFPIWIDVEGISARMDGGNGVARAKHKGVNSTIGFEKQSAGGWLVGGAFRYGNTDVKADDRGSKADIDSFLFGLYGGRDVQFGSGTARWGVGASYGFHDLDGRRRIDLPGMGQRLDSDYHAHTMQFVTDVGYAFRIGDLVELEPFARAAWNSVWTRSFAEKGGSAALRAGGERQGNLSHTLGVRFDVNADGRVSLEGGAGWQHAYGKRDTKSRFAFRDGGGRFVVHGVAVPRNAAYLNAGVHVRLSDRASLRAGYDGVVGGKIESHAGNVSVQLTF